MFDEAGRARIRQGGRDWFRRPPRRHGEVDRHREVSFLELFYDLVYVVLISRVGARLAGHVDWRGAADFVVVFGLVWLGWFNGTFWHELHGRNDGRSRLYIFVQMGLLSLLAVYASRATGADGRAFAITYAVLLSFLTWQWYEVHRIDTDPRYRPTTLTYLAGMVASVLAVAVSAVVGPDAREVLWALVVAGWAIGGSALISTDHTEGFGDGVTGSLVERVGLFTIIVLGEVVVGVVDGMSDAPQRSASTIVTGIVGLTIGMGLWWTYFDLLGRRVPGQRGGRLGGWLYAHLPLTMGIAAEGAALVVLVHHAADGRTPAGAAWLLAGGTAVVLLSVAIAVSALPEDAFPAGMARAIGPTLCGAAVLVLLAGLARPVPIVLVAVVSGVLVVEWTWLFLVLLASGGTPGPPDEVVEPAEEGAN